MRKVIPTILPFAVMESAGSATKDKGLAGIKIMYINPCPLPFF